MSQGKYSPSLRKSTDTTEFAFNSRGEVPPQPPAGNEELDFANYDADGYDSYGYSALDRDGNFVGCGNGVDMAGYTEGEYLSMSKEEFLDL